MSEEVKQPGMASAGRTIPQHDHEVTQPHYHVGAEGARLDFHKLGGLVPAIVQDHRTREVLMVGFMNPEAWEKTLRTRMVTFWSRTRQTLWTKGETSGNFLRVERVWIDCDKDTVLVEAEPNGPTCHTGARSCFFEEVIVDA
ncbi:MAG: phosphoribosyl-AMP cyclohydrolase [Sphingomonadaceae bacterium]